MIRDFNVKYYAAWAIEAREALEERGWMKWINPATQTREIKEEDGSEIDIVEGLRAKALLSQSIRYEHKNRIRNCTRAAEIWSALEDEFAYKSWEDEQRFKAWLSQIHKTHAEDLDTFIARLDELAAQAGNAISDPLCRLDSVDINSAFLNALEYSDIPGEDWGMFPTWIGDKYLTAIGIAGTATPIPK
jgi:gag-polypeptide of LTR copia-type